MKTFHTGGLLSLALVCAFAFVSTASAQDAKEAPLPKFKQDALSL